jgi:TRAP-type C4-dicarboxylate transport system permease small subunit
MAHKPSLLGKFVKVTADFAAGATAAGILIVVLLQVVSRLVGRPVSWSEEATRYLFVWMVFLGLAAGFRTVESARVVVFIAAIPSVFRRLAVPIYVSSSILFFILMGWTGLSLVNLQIMMNEETATLPIPMWVIGLIMPISAILAILAIFESLKTNRDLIELPEVGVPPQVDLEEPDVFVSKGHSS